MNLIQFLGIKKATFLQLLLGVSVDVAFRYFFFAGIAWLLGYVLFRKRWAMRKIIPRFPTSTDVWREIRYSSLTLLIFGLVGALTITASKLGWTKMYWRLGDYSVVWFWSSIFTAIFVHDAYFYWTHRLMHHRWFFRAFHRVHHLSTNPSPWAAYSFAPLEAIVEAGIFPLITLLIPIHPLAFTLVMLWQIVFNVTGHTGYEFYPSWLMSSWLGRFMNTPTNHIMHHEKMRGNYGLYFNVWDRLMRTNHTDYEARFREVTSRHSVE
jgi:Delta7-sterol 5-desaturase